MKYQKNTWSGTMNFVDKHKILPFRAWVKYDFGALDLAHKPRPIFVALVEREMLLMLNLFFDKNMVS